MDHRDTTLSKLNTRTGYWEGVDFLITLFAAQTNDDQDVYSINKSPIQCVRPMGLFRTISKGI